ncbi:Hypothetical protein HEAR2289 [Herminiimonas arsenicoxydans]|uniref:Uncharacterized protein n=1 Tax=Herminiimonas arsenicoxydans TaxID=204773 RepID=A4G7D4_HERAR|nr:Hypothetical protein HEAR2289 [Herminiimonas arsenicoxydans]
MRPEVFEFHQLRQKVHNFTVERKNVFEFRKDRKYHWLQKACFYVLDKIGAYHNEMQSEIKRILIDSDDFAQKLYMQRKYIFKELDQPGRVLLIGAQDFQQLMGSPEIHQMLSFNMKVHQGRDGATQIMGMEVKIIPWMRGMLVMP